jgi:hypothetical protein
VQRFNAAASAAPQQQQEDTDMPAADAAAGAEADGSSSSAVHAKQPFLFLMTPRSIGLGTELPGLSAAIIFESDWHPRLDLQALHRWARRLLALVFVTLLQGMLHDGSGRCSNFLRLL